MPIRTRWLEDYHVDDPIDRRRLLTKYKTENPLMICSNYDSCDRYAEKLANSRFRKNPERVDQDYGIEKCNLYYGCRFSHMPPRRQHSALNRHRLSCYRGRRFYVKEIVCDE